jgi:hypothetical protein
MQRRRRVLVSQRPPSEVGDPWRADRVFEPVETGGDAGDADADPHLAVALDGHAPVASLREPASGVVTRVVAHEEHVVAAGVVDHVDLATAPLAGRFGHPSDRGELAPLDRSKERPHLAASRPPGPTGGAPGDASSGSVGLSTSSAARADSTRSR